MKKLFLFFFSFLFLLSCKESPKFPTDKILEYLPETNECYEYTVVSYDPLKVDDGKLVDSSNCTPSVVGWHIDDVGPVFEWIREMQDLAKKRCK